MQKLKQLRKYCLLSMNNRSFLLILFLVISTNSLFPQNKVFIRSNEAFCEIIDRFILAENKTIDTSDNNGVRVIFLLDIDTFGFVQDINCHFCTGVDFSPNELDSLCFLLREKYSFIYFVETTPRWRFVNDICEFSFPYNNYNQIRSQNCPDKVP